MSRAARLLDLVQALRQHRRPVAGAVLADTLGISLRTLYRDIATLQGQGAPVEGEPGVGYVLKPGFMLPPLMFTQDEIEAIVLGSRWVADRADVRLGEAAQSALAKIAAVLPKDMADDLEGTGLLVAPGMAMPESHIDPGDIREAIRHETCVYMTYIDLKGEVTERTIWPIALGFYDHLRIMVVWCELRAAFRHFRTDRILTWKPLGVRYPKRRQVLLKSWRESVEDKHMMTPEQKNKRMVPEFGSRPAAPVSDDVA
jgi:predicted DNA-binding transcriptional regulator YafY